MRSTYQRLLLLTKPIRHKLVCEKNVFCYFDFDSYLKANYPNSLPFVLKSTFTFEIHCKKHLSTPKKAAKKIKGMQDTLRCLPENTKCSVKYNTIQYNTNFIVNSPWGLFRDKY